MSIRRDGFGCLPLLAASGVGIWLGTGGFLGVVPAGILLALSVLLPFLYFWSPRRLDESHSRSVLRSRTFHRTVREEVGVEAPWPWWRPFAPATVQVPVGALVLPLRVRRASFRKHPDVKLTLQLPPGSLQGLALGRSTLLSSSDATTGDRDFDDVVQLRGPTAPWLAALDAPLRARVLDAVRDRRLRLADGVLHAEVHGTDLRRAGVEQVRELLRLASSLLTASEHPIGPALLERARENDLLVRCQAARTLWSLGYEPDAAEALRQRWLESPEPLLRITACAQSPVDHALPVLRDLAADPATPPSYAVLALRRLGRLEHDGVLAALRTVQRSEPKVQSALAEELARRGAQGGGLALAEPIGGELALAAAAHEGELAFVEASQAGELALIERAHREALAQVVAGEEELAAVASRRPKGTTSA